MVAVVGSISAFDTSLQLDTSDLPISHAERRPMGIAEDVGIVDQTIDSKERIPANDSFDFVGSEFSLESDAEGNVWKSYVTYLSVTSELEVLIRWIRRSPKEAPSELETDIASGRLSEVPKYNVELHTFTGGQGLRPGRRVHAYPCALIDHARFSGGEKSDQRDNNRRYGCGQCSAAYEPVSHRSIADLVCGGLTKPFEFIEIITGYRLMIVPVAIWNRGLPGN